MTKGYLVFEIEVLDLEAYDRYRSAGGQVMEKYGGWIIAGGGRSETLEGERKMAAFFIVEFDSYNKARAFYYSDEYQRALPLRVASAKSRGLLVEGT